MRKLLLLCGMFVLPLYGLTDLLGGLRYGGYSFYSQAISELGSPGTRSAPLVGPLFATATVLLLLFGLGVILASCDGRRPLRVAGACVAAQAIVGLTSAFFPMYQRGSGGNDAPHVVLMGVLTPLLIVLAVMSGRSAFGRGFRRYSLGTVATIVVFGVLTFAYAPRVAAVRPTPGLGVVERVLVYAYMLWTFVLAIALLRTARADAAANRTAGRPLQPAHW